MYHLAVAFEDHTLVDSKTRRENVPAENGWTMDFDAVLGFDVSADFAADDDNARLDLTLDPRAFADDQGV